MEVHAVARNFVTYDSEFQRLVRAFTQNRNVNGGAFGAFQQVGDVARGHVVSRLAVNRADDVAGMNAGAIRWSTSERRNDDDAIIPRPYRHTHAVIFSALIFAQQRVRLGIEEIRVRIQHMQHAGDGAVVNRLVRIHRLGIILLDYVIDLGELLQALGDIGVVVW